MIVVALLILGCFLHLGSGIVAWFKHAFAAATVGAVAGSLCLAAAGILVLAGVDSGTWHLPWPVPGGGIVIAVDALSAVFLLPIALLSALAAVYARGYWDDHESGPRTRAAIGVLVAGMALVVTARQGLWFLLCWEAMALAAWAAMNAEHRERPVRTAGWVYLVFTHLGTACLIAMVVLLGLRNGSLDWLPGDGATSPLDGAIVVLALLGFGAKAGLVPLHAWLPGAHASAPSHVSALLSGVMLKTGIYGLLRVTGMLGEPAPWWGVLIAVVGAVTALYGIASALTQADYKRLLACSSIENLGIIALALGLALLARAQHHDAIAALALAAALLHVWHHAVFKGLLFFGAGAVLHASHTRTMDRLGGLLALMPRTGALVLLGCASAAGLPGLAGFASEWPLYLAGFGDLRGGGWIGIVAVVTLALCGGAALATYAKFYGSVFLGTPRSSAGAHAHDPGRSMLVPLAILAAGSVLLALALPWTLAAVAPAIGIWNRTATVVPVLPAIWCMPAACLGLMALLGLLWWRLKVRLAQVAVGRAVTWDCGYAAPDARMQYTARSFTAALGGELSPLPVKPTTIITPATGLFPRLARLAVSAGDGILDRIIAPAVQRIADGVHRLHLLQQGHLSVYLLYVLVTTIVLLAIALLGGKP